jgi:hypothetical protein
MDGAERDATKERVTVVAELLEHFLNKCRQLKELPEGAGKHAKAAYCALHKADGTEQTSASDAFDNASNVLAEIESKARSLRCLLEAVQQQTDDDD